MFKQLIHYLPNTDPNSIVPVIVETSPELEAAGIEQWERTVFAKHSALALPFGHQWSIVDSNHQWFDSSKLPVTPIEMGKPGALLTPEQVLLRERTEDMKSRFGLTVAR